MQNQWFKDPEKTKKFLEEFGKRRGKTFEETRREWIPRFLFMGCKTGKILQKYLGEVLCDEIIWEEVSKEMGSHSSSIFPADIIHMSNTIVEIKPNVLILMGKISLEGYRQLNRKHATSFRPKHVFEVCHPAARNFHLVKNELLNLKDELYKLKIQYNSSEEIIHAPTQTCT